MVKKLFIKKSDLQIAVDFKTLIATSQMHCCGRCCPIPRGWQIFKGLAVGCDLTLYLKPYFVETTTGARQLGLPPEVPGVITDWEIDTIADPMVIYQKDREWNDLPPIKIIQK